MGTEQLEQSFSSTRAVLVNVTADQMDLPTPCQSWDVRGLVNHVVGTSHYFAATVTAGKAVESASEGDWASGEFVKSFDEGVAASLEAFGAEGAGEKMVELPFGTLPGAIFMAVASNDAFTHGWDLARATGQSTDLDPALAEELLGIAQFAISEEFRGEDGVAPFGPVCEAPDGGTAADRLAAFMGRTV